MTISVRALWIVAVLTGVASAQHSGDIPPALVWNKLKGNCPASLDWAALRGKVVVVSVGADGVFPDDVVRWNEVAQNFQGEQVLFIQVVSGSEVLVDQALKQTAFQGCILFDSDLKNLENFNLPPDFQAAVSVVVDQQGVIAGYSRDGPNERAVRSVLNYQMQTGLLEGPQQPPPQSFDPAPMPSYEVHISEGRDGFGALGLGGPSIYISKNQPLKNIILDLWDTPMARIEFPENLDEGRYDVTAHIPVADRDVLLQLVRQAVESHFGLLIEKEERIQWMYVLSALGNSSPQLQPALSNEEIMKGFRQGSIVGTAQTMQDIAGAFQGLLNLPVVDQTGLKGKYDYSASSKLSGPGAAFDLAHQLGLELTPAERPIEMLVVRKVQ